jgi:hypothetical protein
MFVHIVMNMIYVLQCCVHIVMKNTFEVHVPEVCVHIVIKNTFEVHAPEVLSEVQCVSKSVSQLLYNQSLNILQCDNLHFSCQKDLGSL